MANASPFRVSRHLTAGKDEKEGRMDQGFPPVNPHWLPVVTACGGEYGYPGCYCRKVPSGAVCCMGTHCTLSEFVISHESHAHCSLLDILHDYPSHQFQGFSKSAEAPLWDSLHLFNNLDLNGETLPPSASPRADPKHRVTSCSLSDNTPLAAAPAVATGPSLSTGGAVGQPAPATGQKRFKCPISSCPNTFDRLDRAEACQNRHLGRAPHACRGACGNQTW